MNWSYTTSLLAGTWMALVLPVGAVLLDLLKLKTASDLPRTWRNGQWATTITLSAFVAIASCLSLAAAYFVTMQNAARVHGTKATAANTL